MDFDLTEDQQMLAQTVREFATKSSPVERFRRLRDDPIGWEPNVWKHMGELGWLSVPFPESVGGFGGTFVDVSVILEQLGKQLVPEPYIPIVVLGGMTLLQAGSSSQHERFLQPLMEGDRTVALAWAERSGRYDPTRIETKAEKDGNGWKLSGEKVWVLAGHHADDLIVSARTSQGPTLFVVDAGADGVQRQRVKTMDGQKAAIVKLDGVRVNDDRRLGDEGNAASILDHVLDYGAAAVASEGVGVCQQSLDTTVEYLNTREQFGVKIGSFQALQHRAVDMFVEVELLRSTAIEATVRVQEEDDVARRNAVSAAKYQLTAGGRWVVQQAVQLHGGIGVTDEADVGLYFKRIHALNAMFGDASHHAKRLAAQPGFI